MSRQFSERKGLRSSRPLPTPRCSMRPSCCASTGSGALVVTDEAGGVVGILSERDVVSAVADHGPSALDGPVSGVMTADVVRCAPGDTMEQLMAAMTERRIRHLPVVDGTSLVGIVSIGDVVKRRVSEIQDESQALQDYITQGR